MSRANREKRRRGDHSDTRTPGHPDARTPGHPDARTPGDVWWSRLVLLGVSLYLMVPAMAWWNGVPPLGDDASSHIVTYARVAEALRTGAGFWAPDFNLGFPIGLYYQPLPHFVGGAITAVLGGGEAAVGAYKAVSVLLLALWPWGVAAGGRSLGLSRVAATAAGVVAPLVTSSLGFGLTVRSSLILALHTQAWAAPLLPIALGQVARVLRGERRAWPWAVTSWALLALCHFFYGVATAAVASLWVFCEPRRTPRRALRLIVLGALTATCLLFWVVPLVLNMDAMGGWPFGSATRTEGYGLAGFLGPLLHGHLLDGEVGLPVLSVLALAGAVLSFARPGRLGVGWRGRVIPALLVFSALAGAVVAVRVVGEVEVPTVAAFIVALAAALVLLVPMGPVPEGVPRLLLAFLVLSGLFTIGRAGLGVLVDVFPFNRTVQMFRYLGLFHLAAVWLIGYGVGLLLERAPRGYAARTVAALLVVGALVFPLGRTMGELAVAYRTIDDANVDLEQYGALAEALRDETEDNGAGRIFVHPSSGLYGHFHGALLALWSASDAGQSYGVGLHDSLNFYYLEFFHPERAHDSVLLDLYGFQYIASSPRVDFSRTGAHVVFRTPNYRLWRLDHRVPLCGPVDVAMHVNGFPRDRRRTARAWLNGNGPSVHAFPLLDIPEGLNLGHSTDAPVTVDAVLQMQAPQGPAGALRLDQRSPDRLLCRVDMDRAGAVLFRMGFHPFWRATVDGEPAPTRYAFPAFSAVEVGPGPHEVVLRYELPSYVVPLLALGLCVPIAVAGWSGRRG